MIKDQKAQWGDYTTAEYIVAHELTLRVVEGFNDRGPQSDINSFQLKWWNSAKRFISYYNAEKGLWVSLQGPFEP